MFRQHRSNRVPYFSLHLNLTSLAPDKDDAFIQSAGWAVWGVNQLLNLATSITY
jgi:hypothetical protein